MMENTKRIDWGKIGNAAKEILISIGQGNFLIRMKVHKLFPYILVLFILGCANIWLSDEVEQAALRVERRQCFSRWGRKSGSRTNRQTE